MRYVSLFSGIEAASVAWEPLGWEPVAFAEVEPFCCKLLAKRFPNVPNLGDVTKIDWRPYARTIDIVVGGSPCQAFSVAGKRRGLMDDRGRLMLEYVRAVHDLRPRWLLWENVPGVLSQQKGDAFETLLDQLEQCGYSLAWRVLDAQFYGVAQRRRRVYVVGCLGGGGRAAAVLFERESLRWDFASSREKRASLTSHAGTGSEGEECYTVTTAHTGANGSNVSENISPTLDCASPSAVAVTQKGDIARTLTARFDSSPCADRGSNVVAFAQNTRDEVRMINGDGEISGALAAQPGSKQQTYLCIADDNANAAIDDDLAGTLKIGGGSAFIAYRLPTDATTSARSARGTQRESGASMSARGR